MIGAICRPPVARILTYFPGPGHIAGICSPGAAGALSFSNTVSGEITLVEYVVSLDKLGVHDVEHVGGKNASLGEMISNLAGAGVSEIGRASCRERVCQYV